MDRNKKSHLSRRSEEEQRFSYPQKLTKMQEELCSFMTAEGASETEIAAALGEAINPQKWTNSQSALCAYMYAQGASSVEIAAAIGDKIHPATVRAMVSRRWKLPKPKNGRSFPMSAKTFHKLTREAELRGVTIEVLLSKVFEIIIRDDLLDAILGDEL